jgi:uncharacterized protein DUF3224
MGTHATVTFTIKSWDENPYDAIEGMPTLTRATVTKRLEGDIEGEGMSESLMVYGDDSSANFLSLESVLGRIGGRSGSLVLQGSGTYDKSTGIAKGIFIVVPSSGKGGLRGIRGEGSFVATHAPPASMTLNYDIVETVVKC